MMVYDGTPEAAIKPSEYCTNSSGSVCMLYHKQCTAKDVGEVRKCSGFHPSQLMEERMHGQKTLEGL